MKSDGYDRLQHTEVTTVRINTDDEAVSFWAEERMRMAEPEPMPVDRTPSSDDESLSPPQQPIQATPPDEPACKAEDRRIDPAPGHSGYTRSDAGQVGFFVFGANHGTA